MTTGTLAVPGQILAWDPETVGAFDQGHEDILIVERHPLPGLAEAVAPARVHHHRTRVTVENAGVRAAEAITVLAIASPALAADIARVARSFLAQFGVAEASLRVEVVDLATCPQFHCDNVRVRLVTTYHGPTTEYVRTNAPETVRSAPAFALVFLKGHQHPNHADAIHHRSPAVPPGGKRLCVVLDV